MRRLGLVLLLFGLVWGHAVRAEATYATVASTYVNAGGILTQTTAAINTTGVDLLIMAIGDHPPSCASPTASDSKGNTWTLAGTRYNNTNDVQISVYYSRPTSVGSGHTFTATCPLNGYISMHVQGFSGSVASPYDQQNGNAADGSTSIQPGSITPSADNELVIGAGCIAPGDTYTIDSGFTTAGTLPWSNVQYQGSILAYKIQTTAAAVNPTFGLSNGPASMAATVISFKAAGGAADSHARTTMGVGTN